MNSSEKPKQKGSSFAGFLDGYKARNIASIEPSIKQKVNEIKELINDLISDLDNAVNGELIKSLRRSEKILNNNDEDIIRQIYAFGESIRPDIGELNNIVSTRDGSIKDNYRRMIYDFVELAKMSEDKLLIGLAIDIGGSYPG